MMEVARNLPISTSAQQPLQLWLLSRCPQLLTRNLRVFNEGADGEYSPSCCISASWKPWTRTVDVHRAFHSPCSY